MNFKALLSLAALLAMRGSAHCSTNVTLVINAAVNAAASNVSFTVSAGQVAKVVYANLSSAVTLNVDFGGTSFSYGNSSQNLSGITPNSLPVVTGPATISLMTPAGLFYPAPAFCTIEVSDPAGSFLPSNAVVIPADSGGPVNIILESSADLITWTATLPGVYGSSTTNRFFRVRAQRMP